MNAPKPLPALEGLKEQAKRLRAALEAEGQAITHSKALELIAAKVARIIQIRSVLKKIKARQ